MALGDSEAVKQQRKSGGVEGAIMVESQNMETVESVLNFIKKSFSQTGQHATSAAPSSGRVEPLQGADVLRSVVRDLKNMHC